MKRSIFRIAVLAGASASLAHGGIIAGQFDNFEDGTTQGWTAGLNIPNPPVNMPSGGPAGVNDNYLHAISTGGAGGPGSRMSVFNESQWAGDFSTAGVTAIEFDAVNLGSIALQIGLRVEGPGGNFVSLIPGAAPADGVWRRYTLAIDDAALGGPGGFDLAATLAAVSKFRIEDSRGPIAATLGLDNIRAIPEPATISLLLLGALARRR